MSCSDDPFEIELSECDFCGCQFEPGVGGVGPNREPLCPDCGRGASHPVQSDQVGDRVVMRPMRFG